jgi:hypothetical protein
MKDGLDVHVKSGTSGQADIRATGFDPRNNAPVQLVVLNSTQYQKDDIRRGEVPLIVSSKLQNLLFPTCDFCIRI